MRLKYSPGDRLVMLTLREYIGSGKWSALCDCGKSCKVIPYRVTSGKQVSCGCWRRRARAPHDRFFSERRIWAGIKTRCYNEKCAAFPRYGGRGIVMCDAWRDSFDSFIADMGRRPTSSHSIDRINNAAGYEKANCRWATRKEQCVNRSSTRLIEIDGEKKSVSDWCGDARCTVSRGSVFRRMWSGIDPIAAITGPSLRPRRAKATA
jgi:hypothetical protein